MDFLGSFAFGKGTPGAFRKCQIAYFLPKTRQERVVGRGELEIVDEVPGPCFGDAVPPLGIGMCGDTAEGATQVTSPKTDVSEKFSFCRGTYSRLA